MSTPSQNNLGKRKLLKDSPFQRLAQRTEIESGNKALEGARQIDLARIKPNPRQPRHTWNDESLSELAADIKDRGILQPPIVRPVPNSDEEEYEIVVGERRYRAAKLAGLKDIPVLVRELDDKNAEIVSLVENIQREDLTISDEVSYYKMLQQKYGYSIREIASEVAHKSHSYVEVRLRLAENPEVLELVQTKGLPLQEANILMRDRANLAENLKRIKASLQKSQAVFEKDTTLQNSQLGSKPEQPLQSSTRSAPDLSRPFLSMGRQLKTVLARLDHLGPDERQTVVESIEYLERELEEAKRQLLP